MSGCYALRDVDKRITQKIHFKKRFYERIGIVCSKAIYNQLLYNVVNGKDILIINESSRVKHFLDIFEGQRIIIVYDCFRKSLVTVISESMFDKDVQQIINNLPKRSMKKLQNKERINEQTKVVVPLSRLCK